MDRKKTNCKCDYTLRLGKRLDIDGQELPRLIFFDTSKEDEDVNINQKLIEMIGTLIVIFQCNKICSSV